MIRKCLILAIILPIQNFLWLVKWRVVVGKMKEVIGGVAIKVFVGLKPKMYSFLVDDSGEHKKSKGCE